MATLTGLYEVFSALESAWIGLTGEMDFHAPFDVRIVASSKDPLSYPGGAALVPQATLAETVAADAAIVTDLAIDLDDDPRGRWPEACAWLRRIHEGGGMIGSVCSGSVLLASAGLLDGRTATTHWGFVDHFRSYFPSVVLQPERVLVTVSPADQIVTAGGMSSWQDLALYIVARFHGEAAAIKAAKLFLFGDRSEGQLIYAAMTKPQRHEDAVIAGCQEWLATNYALPHPVSQVSQRSGLATRTFKRRFRAATGFAPVNYVQMLRVEEAKQMLETTDDAIDGIAQQVGYEDPTSFRRLFKRATSVTPGRYRQRYRSLAAVRR